MPENIAPVSSLGAETFLVNATANPKTVNEYISDNGVLIHGDTRLGRNGIAKKFPNNIPRKAKKRIVSIGISLSLKLHMLKTR